MKKILIIKILLLLFSNISFSQKKKYFFDEKKNIITEKEYNHFKNENFEFLKLTFVEDTAKINVIERRKIQGNLKNELHKEIISYLNSISDKKTDSTKTIIINYHPGKDNCNSTADKAYVNDLYIDFKAKIEMKKNITQYFIYKSKKGTEFYDKKIKWYYDNERIIENNFFPLHYPCGSYLIIYPNGKYFLYKGEYYIKKILEQI